MRRLIVCCDGTWNSPDDEDRGKRKPTNITKISRAVLPVDSNDVSQIVYYDEGVGTSWGQRLIGGITGFGLSQNVLEAYRFLAHNYNDGDEVYLFGFSRGAYTVRSLVGLISRIGIVAKDDIYYLPELYRFYRKGSSKREVDQFYLDNKMTRKDVRITMIGVFDTVGALGIPLEGVNELIGKLDIAEFQFHDVTLSSIVDYAYQALAIDERRKPFKPSLWEKISPETRAMEQRWFVGVHSNVGGGYDNDGLANLPLHYIVRSARKRGVAFDDVYLKHYWPYFGDELRDSMTIKYRLLGQHKRKIRLNTPANQVVDESVYKRIEGGDFDSYDPKNVPSQ